MSPFFKFPAIQMKTSYYINSSLHKNQENWYEADCSYFLTVTQPRNLVCSYLKFALYSRSSCVPVVGKEGKVSTASFAKLKKSSLILEKNDLIIFVYGLN